MNSLNFFLFYSHLLGQEATGKIALPPILKDGDFLRSARAMTSRDQKLQGYAQSLSNSKAFNPGTTLRTWKTIRQKPGIALFLLGGLHGYQALGAPNGVKKLDVLNQGVNLNLQIDKKNAIGDLSEAENAWSNLANKPNTKLRGLALKLGSISYFKGGYPLLQSKKVKASGENKLFKVFKQNKQDLPWKPFLSRTSPTFGSGTLFLHSLNHKLTSQAFNLNLLSHLGDLVCLSHYYSPLNSRFCSPGIPKITGTEGWRENAPSVSKRRGDHQLNLTPWFPLVDLEEARQICRGDKARSTQKPVLDATGFGQLVNSRHTKKTTPHVPVVARSWEGRNSNKGAASKLPLVQYSNGSKALHKLQDLTVFYSASWLLREIQDQLSGRKSNIKAVLSRTFLSAQQPVFESLGKGQDTSRVQTLELDNPKKEKDYLGVESKSLMRSEATIVPHLIKGLKVTLTGCMGGKKNMSKTLTKTAGRVPTSTLLEKVDFAKGVVQTKTCSLGVKVWICYN